MSPILQVNEVSKLTDEDRHLLSSISFEVYEGDRLAIVGETGSGKSTLLKSIGGLSAISSGEVRFRDSEVEGPEEKLIAGHEDISYLSQHFELPKFITVQDFLSRKEHVQVEDPEQIYTACRINKLLIRDTRALSGGEKQRVALTKELLKAPELLLLDEPFSNLDFNHKRIIREVLEEIEKDLSVTIILVAHDPKDVLSWADRVMVLQRGKVIQCEAPDALFSRPKNEYVAGLFGAYSLINSSMLSAGGSNDLHQIEDQTFLRPSQVVLGDRASSEYAGKVEQVRFYGTYDELTIRSKVGRVITNARVGLFNNQQEVYFSIEE